MARKRKNSVKKVTRPAKLAKEDEQPTLQFYVLDGPRNLGTLPQVPKNIICKHLAAAGDYVGLNNLRKANKGCKAGVDSYFEERSNILPFESIRVTGFQLNRNSFEVELRLNEDALPLQFFLADLRKRITKISEEEEEIVCLTIPVRNTLDPVIDYIAEVLSPQVDQLIIDRVLNVELLRLVHRLIGETKFGKMKFQLRMDCKLSEPICSEIFTLIEKQSITKIEFIDELIGCDYDISIQNFVENLVKSTKEGSIVRIDAYNDYNPFDISDNDWKAMVVSAQKLCGHARLYEETYHPCTEWFHDDEDRAIVRQRNVFEWRA